jgi:hypothetical protein
MSENFPDLWRVMDTQISETQRILRTISPKTLTCVVIRLSEVRGEERMVKTAKETCNQQEKLHKAVHGPFSKNLEGNAF